MYEYAKILIATQHKKEDAIRKPFEEILRAEIHVPESFNTDDYGTFSGEKKRIGTAYDTVIKKAKDAMSLFNYDYVIASEGSFGPHPLYYFLPADIELLAFIDRENDITVIESEITNETNFSHLDIEKNNDYNQFLSKVKFGSHGLIIKSTENNTILAKGVTERNELESILKSSFVTYEKIRLETDMRAMMNPTRMKAINSLAEKLASRIKSTCSYCRAPGFGPTSVCGNLPCEDCELDTDLYQYRVLSCIKCDHTELKPRDDGLRKAEAKHCPYCNP